VSVTRTPPHKQTQAPAVSPEGGKHVGPEGVDEGLLLLSHVVEVDVVEAHDRELGDAIAVPREVGGDLHRATYAVDVHVLGHRVEPLDGLGVPAHGLGEDVGAPLVKRDVLGLLLGGRPGQVHLQGQGASPSGVAVGGDHLAQHLDGLVDGDQPVRPGRHPRGGGRRHRGADESRAHVGQVPEPGPVDRDEPLVGDLLAVEQARDHLDALLQALRAHLLARPRVAGDVLVARLTAAEGGPEPSGEHLGQGRDLLGDHGGVVALAGRADAPELEVGPGEHRT
jgi:hypothetical protein